MTTNAIARDVTSATLEMTGPIQAAGEYEVASTSTGECWRQQQKLLTLTDDGLGDLNGGYQAMLVERRGGERKIVVRGRAVQRVYVGRQTDPAIGRTGGGKKASFRGLTARRRGRGRQKNAPDEQEPL